ncbi:MAG: hypothetical protein D6698_16770 [Gammaproteobacteria bacterium]|nr:MAG: hypothetical protein D6698_16770 [Gammaproteobacteria bacterium]
MKVILKKEYQIKEGKGNRTLPKGTELDVTPEKAAELATLGVIQDEKTGTEKKVKADPQNVEKQ